MNPNPLNPRTLRPLNPKMSCLQGSVTEYTGEAVNPINLSLWERMTGVGKLYNPKLDARQKTMESSASYGSLEMLDEPTA